MSDLTTDGAETLAEASTVRLANDLCASGHDADKGHHCQECYDIACAVHDSDWMKRHDAEVRAEVARLRLDRAELADRNEVLRTRIDRAGEIEAVRIAEAVAAVTPCSCSVQRARAEAAEQQLADMRAGIEKLADEWEALPEPPDEEYEGTTEGHYAFGEWLATTHNARRLRAALAEGTGQ